MEEHFDFQPIRRQGEWFHTVTIVLLVVLSIFLAWRTIRGAAPGNEFLVSLLPLVFLLVLILYFVYNLYALEIARYSIDRNRIILQWGFRTETIPMGEVQWVRLESDFNVPIPKPLIRWPGVVSGHKAMRDGTPIEFLASTTKSLVLIGTKERIYAISPVGVNKLLTTYQRLTELGPLVQSEGQSIYTTSLIQQIWADTLARILIFLAVLTTLILTIWVLIVIPNRETINLGFTSLLQPKSPVESFRLLLLPFVNGMILITNTLVGIGLYRREDFNNFAYLLWSSSIFINLLFLLALGQLLQIR